SPSRSTAHASRTASAAVVAAGEDAKAVRWSALAVLDDRDDVLGTDEHKLRWRAWLYWSNLLQFLAFAGGDGVQLAGSRAAAFPVDVLAVTGGIGEFDSLIAAHQPQEPSTALAQDVPATAAAEAEADGSVAERAVSRLLRDAAWDEEILPLLEEDEPDSALTRLARKLAEHGKQAPVFGYELGARGWPADFAWQDPGVRIAVVAPPHGEDDEEAHRRDKAYTDAGWTVRTAADWLDHLEPLLDALPDAPEAGATNDPHDSHGNGRQH
ncbi:RNA helicase, partial [Streptomyces minutiscleroticus]